LPVGIPVRGVPCNSDLSVHGWP